MSIFLNLGLRVSKAMVLDYLTLQHLKSMIGTKKGNNGHEGVLFRFPKNFQAMIDWASQNERVRIMIVNIIPFAYGTGLDDNKTGNISKELAIHPFAKLFLDNFGDSEKVLDKLAANLGTFGTVDGSKWYFKMLSNLASLLTTHPNPTLRA